MNKVMGEMIGEKVGVWLEADVGEDDLAAGKLGKLSSCSIWPSPARMLCLVHGLVIDQLIGWLH
jgi:hypothetical protein